MLPALLPQIGDSGNPSIFQGGKSLKKRIYSFISEKEHTEGGTEGEGETIPNRLCAEHGAPCGVRSQDSGRYIVLSFFS